MDAQNSLIAIEVLVQDYNFVKDKLSKDEISIAQNIQRHLTKMLILSCASYYENTIIKALTIYSQEHSRKYKKKPHGFDEIGKRSFYKMFDFGREKPNGTKAFLSPLNFFGTEFKDELIKDISSNIDAENDLTAFQEICTMRNSLIHNDLITYINASSKSFEDIKELHDKAIKFVELLVDKLK